MWVKRLERFGGKIILNFETTKVLLINAHRKSKFFKSWAKNFTWIEKENNFKLSKIIVEIA